MEEEWRPVTVDPFSTSYEISSVGRVRRVYRSKELIGGYRYLKVYKYGKIRKYPYITLFTDGIRKRFNIHRLVAEIFIGPCPDGLVVNHKDGNKENNDYQNLEYTTQSENIKHAFSTGLNRAVKGINNWRGKLTDQQVLEIREAKKTLNTSNKELARMYNVTPPFICNIIKGRRRVQSAL
jgi:hypothetical protein